MKAQINRTFTFTLPLAMAELAYISMAFTDTFLFSLLGVETLAGAGLGTSMLHFMTIVFMGLVAGVGNLVAIAYGAQRDDEINATVQAGVLVSLVLFCMALCVVAVSPQLLAAFGQGDGLVRDAYAYMSVAVWSVLPILLLRVFRGLSTGVGHRISIFKVSVFGALLNFPLSYALMEGVLFVPQLGILGVGIATSIVALLMLVTFLYDIYKRERFRNWQIWRVRTSYQSLSCAVRNVLQMGLPIGVAYGMEAGLFAVAGLLAGSLGAVALASHHIALQCSIVAFRIPAAIAQATSALVGQSFGASQPQMVRAFAMSGLVLGAAYSVLSSFVFLVFPDVLVSIFVSANSAENFAVIQTATVLLAIAAAFQLADGLQVIAMGALRGLRRTYMPTILTVSGYWLVGLPAAFLLSRIDGVSGIWWGLALGLGATAVMLVLLLHRVCGNMNAKLDLQTMKGAT
ncbi:multidrug resistance protein, MATE family [Aliiroseovarius halocynthiae]|nr:MATE family efflux transporter [Aliiroseovarius halocynthiae]SMR71963.1 multidrug resistance protein, MATE family [Aliiroseovarius halocynthiae]